MGGVDEQVDVRACGREPVDAAESAGPDGAGREAGVAGAAGERGGDDDAGLGRERVRELAGLRGAAEDEDARGGAPASPARSRAAE